MVMHNACVRSAAQGLARGGFKLGFEDDEPRGGIGQERAQFRPGKTPIERLEDRADAAASEQQRQLRQRIAAEIGDAFAARGADLCGQPASGAGRQRIEIAIGDLPASAEIDTGETARRDCRLEGDRIAAERGNLVERLAHGRFLVRQIVCYTYKGKRRFTMLICAA